MMPQPPLNGSMQHAVSPFSESGTVHVSLAHGTEPSFLAVLGDVVLPLLGLLLLSLPQAQRSVINPNAIPNERFFICTLEFPSTSIANPKRRYSALARACKRSEQSTVAAWCAARIVRAALAAICVTCLVA
jgi:hypothetical protein